MLSIWWDTKAGQNLYNWLLKLMPSLILWNLWKARNVARHDGEIMQYATIIDSIKKNIVDLYHGHKLLLTRGKLTQDCLSFFKLNTFVKQQDLKLVLWKPPAVLWVKINEYDASKGNPGISVAGGIFRDHKCNFLHAFSKFLGFESCLG